MYKTYVLYIGLYEVCSNVLQYFSNKNDGRLQEKAYCLVKGACTHLVAERRTFSTHHSSFHGIYMVRKACTFQMSEVL